MTAISVSLLGRLILFGFGVAVHGLVFPGPRPTDDFLAAQINGADTDGWSPKPTPGPKHHEVLERQLDEAAVVLAAPDNTCGFLFGRQGGSIVCPGSTSQCVFVTASGDKAGSVDCCDDESCNVRVKSCVDEDNIDGCDRDCLTDPLILKCTRSFARYCNTMTWPAALGLGDFEDFYCGAKKTRGPQSVDITYTGQRSRSLTKSLLVPTQTTTRSPTTSSASKKSSSTRSSESQPDDFGDVETISSEPIPEPGSTTINTADRAATGSVAPAAAPAGGSKSDVGAIVGGIVGAIAAIAMIVLGLFFLRRQKKKKGDPLMSIPSAIPPQHPPPMSEQPPQPPSQPPVVSPFADPPQHTQRYPVPPPLVIPPATPTSSGQRPITSSRYSPVSETMIAALAAIPDTAKKSPNDPKSPNYPGPSPMSTPPGSPKPPHYQPFQPSNTYYPNQPQYRPSPTSSTPTHVRDYSEVGPVEIQQAWITPAPPSQDDSNSPSSAFNAFPVSPVSALSANPLEHHQRIGVPGVPLILQPGLGMQRLPPGTVRQVTVQRGASRRGQNPRRESQAPQSPVAQ